ncbi:MAG: lysostaphin resistance A-like protein [bacterium]
MNQTTEKKAIVRYAAAIFWHADERRLRLLWRLLGTALFAFLLMVVNGMAFSLLKMDAPAFWGQLQANIFIIFAIWMGARWLDRRKFAETGIQSSKNWWVDFGFGLALGAVLMTLIFGVERMAGWVTISETFRMPNPDQSFLLAMLTAFVFYIGVGFAEELTFRGYLLLNVAEGLKFRFINARWAVLISWFLTSAVFGIAHANNPNATLISSVNIAMAGIMLGLAYVLTGSLAIPIGLHITWNFFQGNVFGFPVSGTNVFPTTVTAIEQGGPEIWTGGVFGPEAGLLGLLAMILGIVLIAGWIRMRTGELKLLTAIADPPPVRLKPASDEAEGEIPVSSS